METILSIAGKPGLYKLVSRGNRTLIVETLDETHKRVPAFATDRVTSLGDIAMYTDADEVPLWEVLDNVSKKEEGKPSSFNYKKAPAAELHDYFAEVLPNYDRDVYTTATSRSSSSGTTSSLSTVSQISRLLLLQQRVRM